MFKTGVSDVRMDVQVTANDNPVRGLKADDFHIADEGQSQKIVYFAHDAEPLNLLILLDISGSMQTHIDEIAATARQAMDYLRPGDSVGIMVFAKTTALHKEFGDNLAEAARQISSAVRDHDVGTGTQINAAVVEAAHYIAANAGPVGRRAVLILTDNLSMSYRLTDGQVIRELDKSDTVLNAIVVGRAIRPGPQERYTDPDQSPADVFHLAEQTGGEAVRTEQAGVPFAEIIQRMRMRYTLAYHEPPSTPGTFRHVQVTLTESARLRFPAAAIRARAGYYSE